VGGVLVLVLALPALRAEDKSKDKAASPKDQYAALVKEFDSAQQAFYKAYSEAKTDAERQKAVQEKYPQPDKFAAKFMELAQQHPKDPVAIDALVWVATRTGGSSQKSAMEVLARDHANSDKMAGVCDSLIYSDDPASEALLRKLMVANPHRDVQGRACLALALHLRQTLQSLQALANHPDAIDKATADRLKKLDATKVSQEAEHLLERASTSYADVKHPFSKTIGDRAKGELYEIRFLAVGKDAPDIKGSDQDAKSFKLSDYRGKVVLLDFWGNW
jgi:hypothetical protein